MTAAVGFEFFLLPLLDPSVRWNAVVLWMGCIGEINRVVFAFACLDMLIFFEKRLLLSRVLFAGNMRWLLL
jgi:hypothetical protein